MPARLLHQPRLPGAVLTPFLQGVWCSLLELGRSWFLRAGFSTFAEVVQELHRDDYYRRYRSYVQHVKFAHRMLSSRVEKMMPQRLFPAYDSKAFAGQSECFFQRVELKPTALTHVCRHFGASADGLLARAPGASVL